MPTLTVGQRQQKNGRMSGDLRLRVVQTENTRQKVGRRHRRLPLHKRDGGDDRRQLAKARARRRRCRRHRRRRRSIAAAH